MVQKNQLPKELSFSDYYGEVKKQKPCLIFREEIATVCGVTENAVSRWLSGATKPDMLKKQQIAKLLKRPVKVLFPED